MRKKPPEKIQKEGAMLPPIEVQEKYMKRAIELAKNGAGKTNPNPLVGAVVVKDGAIVSEGWHDHIGGYHAERNALLACADGEAEGADLYVTLEPCCHTGKTPPCTDIILKKGVKRVFVGASDPNPLVGGKGVAILRQHGVTVTTGILAEECFDLNRVFFHYIATKTPYVIAKFAMTLDGKIATVSGDSKWISSSESLFYSQQLRNRCAAILVGIGTVLADDPLLTCRIPGGTNPLRIICDSTLRTPLDAALVKTAKEVPTLVVCGSLNDGGLRQGAATDADGRRQGAVTDVDLRQRAAALAAAGVEVLALPGADGKVDLAALVKILSDRGIDSLLIEGGGDIHYSALSSGIVNEINAFIAPKIVGGKAATGPVGGTGFDPLSACLPLSFRKIERLGPDILVTADVKGGA